MEAVAVVLLVLTASCLAFGPVTRTVDIPGIPSGLATLADIAFNHAANSLDLRMAVTLKDSEIFLKETLVLDASNVDIYGTPNGTIVHCPEEGRALVIRGTSISLTGLHFTGCMKGAIGIGELEEAGADVYTGIKRTVRIDSCSFTGNRAVMGGAISLFASSLEVANGTFRENVGYGGDEELCSCCGGAIFAWYSRLDVRGSMFDLNDACLLSDDLVFFSANSGGAIFASATDVVAMSTIFSNNTALVGGGLAAYGALAGVKHSKLRSILTTTHDPSRPSQLMLEDVTFVRNIAWQEGACHVDEYAATVQNSRFDSNLAVNTGAVGVFGTGFGTESPMATYTFMKIKGTSFVNNAALSAGALTGGDVRLFMNDCEFVNNSVVTAEALLSKLAKPVKWSSELEDLTEQFGGALELVTSCVVVKHTAFQNNTSIFTAGAVYLASSRITLKDATFANNSAAIGGVFLVQDSDIIVKDSQFVYNTASEMGGAVYLLHSDVTMKDTQFWNSSASEDGGAIWCKESNVTVKDAQFFNNTAARGCVMWADESNVTLKDNEYCNNGGESGEMAVWFLKSSMKIESLGGCSASQCGSMPQGQERWTCPVG